MKISWLKSSSRSAISEITPLAADWNSVWASTPVKVKVSRLKSAFPKLACSDPPRTVMKISGKIREDTSRAGSRSSFMKSRWAMERIALTWCIGLLQYGDVGVLQGRQVGPDAGERGVDRLEDRVDRRPVEL